jgi:hypothetical protein
MNPTNDFFDVSRVDFQRFRTTFGIFDSLGMSAMYNFPLESIKYMSTSGARENEALKTSLHETVHVYQAFATSYGYYLQLLEDFQSELVMIMLSLTRQTERKVVLPLSSAISTLRSSGYADKARNLLSIWCMAEFIKLYLEGNIDSYERAVFNPRHREIANRPVIELWAILDYHLSSWLNSDKRAIIRTVNEPIRFGSSRSKYEDENDVGNSLRATLGNVKFVLESAAKSAEYWSLTGAVPSSVNSSIPYYHLFKEAAQSLGIKDIGVLSLTFGVLADLSLNPPIAPQHRACRERDITLGQLDPLVRFILAMRTARHLKPVENLARDYVRFATEISDACGWPTFELLNSSVMECIPPEPVDCVSVLYYRAASIRQQVPYLFNDMSVWLDREQPIVEQALTFWFTPAIMYFSDGRVLFHRDRGHLEAFVGRVLLGQFLRSILLTGARPIVKVPYPASEEQLEFWKSKLNEDLATLGLSSYRVSVVGTATPAHQALRG